MVIRRTVEARGREPHTKYQIRTIFNSSHFIFSFCQDHLMHNDEGKIQGKNIKEQILLLFFNK